MARRPRDDYSLAYMRYLLRETPHAPKPKRYGLKDDEAGKRRREVHRLCLGWERGDLELREISTVAMTRSAT